MKITRLTTYPVPPRWLFLKVETDAGVTGWGEPVVEGRAATVRAAVEELSDYLVPIPGSAATSPPSPAPPKPPPLAQPALAAWRRQRGEGVVGRREVIAWFLAAIGGLAQLADIAYPPLLRRRVRRYQIGVGASKAKH